MCIEIYIIVSYRSDGTAIDLSITEPPRGRPAHAAPASFAADSAIREAIVAHPSTVVYAVDVAVEDDARAADLDHITRTLKALRDLPQQKVHDILHRRCGARIANSD